MPDAPFNVLFLCTGNSARSIMAEAILNRAGVGKFRAFSAGSHPKGKIHPRALSCCNACITTLAGLRSKNWQEFAKPGAPKLDFVFTVCDNAAAEVCPVWPGQPMTAHWGIPDPVEATGNETEIRLAFADALRMLTNRINIFISLPILRSINSRCKSDWTRSARSKTRPKSRRRLRNERTARARAPFAGRRSRNRHPGRNRRRFRHHGRSGCPAEIRRSRCSATPFPPAPSWSSSLQFSARSRAPISTRR